MDPVQREAEQEAHWERALRRKFGLSASDYYRMLSEQDGRCLICRRSSEEIENSHTARFSVDHDHACCPGVDSCGECIRGLLCSGCNGKLGWYEKYRLEVAAYLAAAKEVV
jgi:hypothetical protein